jgi:hypothetical protein
LPHHRRHQRHRHRLEAGGYATREIDPTDRLFDNLFQSTIDTLSPHNLQTLTNIITEFRQTLTPPDSAPSNRAINCEITTLAITTD